MATGIPFGWQVENANGTPVSGARIHFKIKGTSSNATTYTDSALTVPAANPVVADAAGWFNTYLDPGVNYDVTINSADDAITYQSSSKSPSDTGAQPLDATLTALAGAGFENGKVLLGTGVDTVSNVLPGALSVMATGSTTARTLADRFTDRANILDYGAVSGGSAALNTAAFVAAIATGKDVIVPAGEFLVNADEIIITTTGQGIFGPEKPAETEFRAVAKIEFTATSGNIIDFRNAAPVIKNLIVEGPSRTASATAIRAAKTTNTANLDFDVRNMLFLSCQVAMDVTGRGLDVLDVGFGNVGTGIIRRWPTSGVDPGTFQDLPWGWRKDLISNIRWHASGTLLDNSADANAADYQISLTDVVADQLDCRIFHGACKSSLFANIKAKHGSSNRSTFLFTATITDTVFNAINASGTPSDTSNSPGSLMIFNANAERCNFSDINGGYFVNSAIGVAGDLVDCTMTGLVINNVNTDATSIGFCISVTGDITRTAVTGSSLMPGSATGANLSINCAGTITDSFFQGIAYDKTKNSGLLIGGGYTDGGGNIIQSGRYLNIDKNPIGWATVGPIADDTMVAITPPRPGGIMVVCGNATGAAPDGAGSNLVFFDVGASKFIDQVTGWASTTGDNLTIATTAVSGTTGADGSMNIGMSGDDLQFENRRGAAVTLQIAFL